jgi:uncharacterized protein (TIGR03435 family)
MTKSILGATVALVTSLGAWAQTAAPLNFEVASVKPSPPMTGNMIRMGMGGGPGSSNPGTVTAENTPLKTLVIRAYGLKNYQVSGPDWIDSQRFDIVAKVPAGATKADVLVMWQNLLAERFKLTVHRESKELPMYALVVAKNGPKLTEATDAPPPTSGAPSTSGGTSFTIGGVAGGAMGGGGGMAVGGSMGRAPVGRGGGRVSSDKMAMSSLADMLTSYVDRPVIDQTGLTGRYKLKLEWQGDDLPSGTSASAAGSGDGSPSAAAPDTAPTLRIALQEQLGLKLEARKGPIELLVVDHAEKTPIEN